MQNYKIKYSLIKAFHSTVETSSSAIAETVLRFVSSRSCVHWNYLSRSVWDIQH